MTVRSAAGEARADAAATGAGAMGADWTASAADLEAGAAADDTVSGKTRSRLGQEESQGATASKRAKARASDTG